MQEYVCAAENNDKTLSDKYILVNNILRRTTEQSQTSNTSSSKLSDRGDRHDHITESYEGDILPNFDIWMKEMRGNIQNEGAGDDSLLGVEGDCRERVRAHGDRVQAQGGEVMGGGGGGEGVTSNVGGQGGRVKLAVKVLEGGSTDQRLPRFVKPSGKRGVKRDSLIQTRIESLAARGEVQE